MLLDIIMHFRFLFEITFRLVYLRGHRHIRRQLLVSRYVRNNLVWSDIDSVSSFENSTVRKGKTIWILWTQGIENAPDLVKKCYQSVLKYKGDYDVIVLTRNNIDDYVKLPQHVEQLYYDKKMSEALHSDMVRLYLLIHYGGIWRDATCYQTAPYPEYIKTAPLFMFGADLMTFTQPTICSNWFISATDANNLLLKKVYNFLCEYHSHFSIPHDYFIFHLTVSVLVREDDKCRHIWEEIPYVCNMNPHVFLFSFAKPYSYKAYQHILSSSFIHKLTYKYSPDLLHSETHNMLQHFLEV